MSNNVYSVSLLEFLQEQAQRQIAEREKAASAKVYTQEDARLLADLMLKEASDRDWGEWAVTTTAGTAGAYHLPRWYGRWWNSIK